MKRDDDRAVVIGAGAIGVACAHFLNRSGWQVTVVDGGQIGEGASYGNACLILPSHSHPIPAPGVIGQALRWMLKEESPFYVRPRIDSELFRWFWSFRRYCTRQAAERGFRASLRLSRASAELFEEWRPELDFYSDRKGSLNVCLTDGGFEEFRHEQEALDAAGFVTRLLSPQETLALEPALSEKVRGGLFVEGDSHGDCLQYVRSMAANLKDNGVRFLIERPVSRIVVEDGRVHGVQVSSPGEELRAGVVVLAAGTGSAALAAPLGIRIPLQPAKGYSCTVDAYPGSPGIPLCIKERRMVITPLGDRLRFAGTFEMSGHDLHLNPVRYRAVVNAGRESLNGAFLMANEHPWCGLRPVLPDGLPIIGKPPGIDGLIVAAGHAMLGFTQSPITGKLVAELAGGEKPSQPLEPFRLDRF